MPISPTGLAVSIQAAGFRKEPRHGHLTPGLLMAPSYVVVPEPPAGLVDGTTRVEVLVLPLPLGRSRIERIAPTRVTVVKLHDTTMVALDLEFPSRHAPSYQRNGLASGAVRNAVAAHGGRAWAALEAVGVTGSSAHVDITPELLDDSAWWIEQQSDPRYEQDDAEETIFRSKVCPPGVPVCK
ncbi:hypothetical protein [Saccharothrix luteola]|uniref:hypothetical protein n=1 Tax=Saccharothrix luteola TaxID=2893018 RepID=UPI001E4BD53D|nr:hypothetical protein [Saccharothrix luteola]MCC8246975.1 hypothetical protein [Saccharothrix luteola]